MQPEVLTYTQNNPAFPQVVGFLILNNAPNFGLIFRGATVAEVEQKAKEFWEVEHPKAMAKVHAGGGEGTAGGRGSHNVGKTWVIHHEKKEKFMINRSDLPAYLAQGYVQGGARTQVGE